MTLANQRGHHKGTLIGVTYGAFLAVFLCLPILVLALFLRGRVRRFHLVALGLVCLLAFVYTTPWDNYAAYKRLWTFDPQFVWGPPFRAGYLPLEEYLFYLAEAVFVCLVVIALARIPFLAPDADPDDAGKKPPRPNNGEPENAIENALSPLSGSPLLGRGGRAS